LELEDEHPRMALPVTIRRYLGRGYLWSVEVMNSEAAAHGF
jgi:hypothetical protein